MLIASSVIGAQGEVQQPAVCLLASHLTMEEVYLDVPVCHHVTLLNQTLLDTTFQWGQVCASELKSP